MEVLKFAISFYTSCELKLTNEMDPKIKSVHTMCVKRVEEKRKKFGFRTFQVDYPLAR